ncbi:hypothetical protein B0T17DRAFT_495237, partial [Bombardia bombarda]
SYPHDSTSTLSTIEAPTQPSAYINFPPPVTAYTPEGGHFYHPPATNVFTGLDVRPRLGSSSSTSGPGMAHAPRSAALPHPGTHISTRDIYSPATPSYGRRQPDHIPRSPSYPGMRRHPLSPTASTHTYNQLKMDPSGYGSKTQQNIPPLGTMQSLGNLSYSDASSTPIKVDINGTIDKGFFLADDNWTCYRRNYFSCVCSYTLAPTMPPSFPTPTMQFVPNGSQNVYPVYGFAMSISAIVADSENQAIELVQHTPKRDKGPIAKPEKVRLSPKPPQPPSHHLGSMFGGGGAESGMVSSRPYEQSYGQQQQNPTPSEHTFERIQFKQATANNGKRRAAQQYYHLLVELWADLGPQHSGTDPFMKVAFRKSAKMIVRGRSPGHYQSERRGSTSSGPGGSGGGSIQGGGGYNPGLMTSATDYSTSGSMMQGGYGYDPRHGGGYGGRQHHEITMEPMITPEEAKAITEPKAYQYFPAPIYEGEQQHAPHQPPHQQHDSRHQHQVEMFSHSTRNGEPVESGSGSGGGSGGAGGFDTAPKAVKPELESNLPSLFFPGSQFYTRGCGRYEGKSNSSGFYPTANILTPSSTVNMT